MYFNHFDSVGRANSALATSIVEILGTEDSRKTTKLECAEPGTEFMDICNELLSSLRK